MLPICLAAIFAEIRPIFSMSYRVNFTCPIISNLPPTGTEFRTENTASESFGSWSWCFRCPFLRYCSLKVKEKSAGWRHTHGIPALRKKRQVGLGVQGHPERGPGLRNPASVKVSSYLTHQSRPSHQVLPASLNPYLFQGMAGLYPNSLAQGLC